MYLPIPDFIPTANRILVRKIVVDKSKGGVLMPPSQKMLFEQGVVVSAGPGEKNTLGEVVPLSCKVGDHVLFAGGSAADVRMENGEILWLMTESAILGIVRAKPLPGNIVTATASDIDSVPERTADVTDKLAFEE